MRVASEKRSFTPLDQYRRTELLVRPDLEAKCKQKKQSVRRRVSAVPEYFPEPMVGLRGGNMATVELIEIGRRIEVRFKLMQPKLRFQQKVLDRPKRWVIEIGEPLTLTDGVLDEQPFHPYPIAVSSIDAKLPPARIHQLPDTTEANRQLNECYQRWIRNDLNEALAKCGKLRMNGRVRGIHNGRASLRRRNSARPVGFEESGQAAGSSRGISAEKQLSLPRMPVIRVSKTAR